MNQEIIYQEQGHSSVGGKLGLTQERETFLKNEILRITDASFHPCAGGRKLEKAKVICDISATCESKEELAYAMWALGAYMYKRQADQQNPIQELLNALKP